jgi:hypothetical protein
MSLDGWDEVFERIRAVFFQTNGISINNFGVTLHGKSKVVKLTAAAEPAASIFLQTAEGHNLVPLASWHRQSDGHWLSSEGNLQTKSEMVDAVESLCKKTLLG